MPHKAEWSNVIATRYETSVNNVGDSPGSLKLRDVACVRQNDQL